MIVLVDTCVWIDHFRRGLPLLSRMLTDGEVLMHPFVAGELACGNFRKREQVLSDLNALPRAQVATQAEVLHLLEVHKLFGQGLGWIDLHLLASAILSQGRFWTIDKSLHKVASSLNLA